MGLSPIENGGGVLKQNSEEKANLLRGFNKMLDCLQDSFENVHHVNFLGTLSGGKAPEVAEKKYKNSGTMNCILGLQKETLKQNRSINEVAHSKVP